MLTAEAALSLLLWGLVTTYRRKHSVAGGIAGSMSVLLLHPFDVVKTRLQGDLALHACSNEMK